MERERELKAPVTLKELAEFMAVTLQIAAELSRDPQYRFLLTRIRDHQLKPNLSPRMSAFLGELLDSIDKPPAEGVTSSKRQPPGPIVGIRKP